VIPLEKSHIVISIIQSAKIKGGETNETKPG